MGVILFRLAFTPFKHPDCCNFPVSGGSWETEKHCWETSDSCFCFDLTLAWAIWPGRPNHRKLSPAMWPRRCSRINNSSPDVFIKHSVYLFVNDKTLWTAMAYYFTAYKVKTPNCLLNFLLGKDNVYTVYMALFPWAKYHNWMHKNLWSL